MLLSGNKMTDTVSHIRAFNRFYTRWVGALENHHLGSDFSLAEVRVLYEIAHHPGLLARDIIRGLDLDPGYLSRMLKRFEQQGYITREASKEDSRASALRLTDIGEMFFRELNRRAAERVEHALSALDEQRRSQLVSAASLIRHLLDEEQQEPIGDLRLRQARSGDYGWAIERHGLIYSTEFGWGPKFEGFVAELFGSFARQHDSRWERCWIADVDGKRAGCVYVVKRESEMAQLRCLLVDPWARGHGVGKALVDECIKFARSAGYRRMMLWTHSCLESARRIYEAAGFLLVQEEPHVHFGVPLVGQNWEMVL